MSSVLDNSGSYWLLGVAAGDSWPLVTSSAYLSGTSTTNEALSYNLGAKVVQILGIQITTAAAVSIDIIYHDGVGVNVIPGLSRSAAAAGYISFGPDGVRFESALGQANLGIRCGAGAVATLFYRKLA